jgi:hypothetical protein
MPFWVTLLIKLALQFGVPWLENHVPPAIASLIEAILKIIQGHPGGQAAGVKAVQEHLDNFPGFFEGAQLKREMP